MTAASSRMRHGSAGYIMILGALTAFGSVSIDMYLPAFPILARHFGVGSGAIETTLAAFFAGFALGQVFSGPISDRIGRRRPLIVGILVYIVASVAITMAPDAFMLGVFRFIQALGACTGVIVARAMVRDTFDERESARVYSLLMATMGVSPILAPILGQQLLAFYGWQAIFWLQAGFGVVCLVMVAGFLPETLPPEDRAKGGMGTVLKTYAELLVLRRFIGLALSVSAAYAVMFANITASPHVLMELYQVSPGFFSINFGVNAAGFVICAQINAVLVRRVSSRVVLRAALTASLFIGLALGFCTYFEIGGLWTLLALLFLVLCTLGFVPSNSMAQAMAWVGGRAGMGAALIGALQFLGAFLAGLWISSFGSGSAATLGVTAMVLLIISNLLYRWGAAGTERA